MTFQDYLNQDSAERQKVGSVIVTPKDCKQVFKDTNTGRVIITLDIKGKEYVYATETPYQGRLVTLDTVPRLSVFKFER